MEWYWIAYLVGVGILLIVGLIWYLSYMGSGNEEERTGARITLSAPVWPLAAPYFLFLSIRALWRVAELSKPKPNSARKETDY